MQQPPISTTKDAAVVAEGLQASVRHSFWQPPKHVLRGVSFVLARGETVAFLGHNGAGKTTTLRILLGLLKPCAGTASLFGVPASAPTSRVGLGFLPERAYYPSASTAWEFVRIHAGLCGLRGPEASAQTDAVLHRVGLGDSTQRRLGEFSKGMLQRAGLAQALVGRPRLLLLDEPFSGLDPMGRAQVRALLVEERARGCTILFSTHVLADAEALCERAVILRQGEVVLDGSLEAFFARTQKQAAVDVQCTGISPAQAAAICEAHAHTQAVSVSVDKIHFIAPHLQAANGLADAVRAAGGSLLRLQPQPRNLTSLFAAEGRL